MTKRRVPGYSVGTKGHSVLKKRVYVQPIVKRFPVSLARDEYLTPAMPGIYYDDYYDLPAYSPNKVNALTNAILDDTYDLHARSRGRDNRLLSQMNEALVSTEIHSSPKSAVAARRVMRKQAPVKSASPPRSVRPRRRAAVKEALLVGGTAEMQPKRRPKSKYAAERLRELNRAREEPKEQLSLLRASAPPPPSTYLRSSRPTQPSREWRAIRDVDGFTKPKNVLSWQHRIEARISPDDLLYQPTSYVKMRGRVRDVQDKMDKHRQLLDRNNRADAGAGLASGGSFSERTEVEEDYGSPRVSALRRKLRKVICKNRSDPNYYRD